MRHARLDKIAGRSFFDLCGSCGAHVLDKMGPVAQLAVHVRTCCGLCGSCGAPVLVKMGPVPLMVAPARTCCGLYSSCCTFVLDKRGPVARVMDTVARVGDLI